MTNMQNLQQLIDEKAIQPLRAPVPEETFKEFELKVGFHLPPDLRTLYSLCDGIEFHKSRFRIMRFEEACVYWDQWQRYGSGLHDYFPFTENNDSDPFCICCDNILYGYIVHMTHEREPHVKYRSLDAFSVAIERWFKRGHWYMDDITPEIRGAKRTPHDIETARKLIQAAPSVGEDTRNLFLRFAMKLFSSQHVAEIAPFLDDEDMFVSRDAKKRLKEIKNSDAVRVLQDLDTSMHQFMEQCVEHLKQSGIDPVVINFDQMAIRLDPGPIWLNIPMFYAERHRADFWDYFMSRITFFIDDQQAREKYPLQCEAYLKQFKLPKMSREGTVFYFWPLSLEGQSVKIDLGLLVKEQDRPDFWGDYLIEYVYHKINQAEGWE